MTSWVSDLLCGGKEENVIESVLETVAHHTNARSF